MTGPKKFTSRVKPGSGASPEEFGSQQMARMMELRDAPHSNMGEALLKDMRDYIKNNDVPLNEQESLINLALATQAVFASHFVQALTPELPKTKEELRVRIEESQDALRQTLRSQPGPSDADVVAMYEQLYQGVCARLRMEILTGAQRDAGMSHSGMN